MQSIIAETTKALNKSNAKFNKTYGVVPDEIGIIQEALARLETMAATLKDEVSKDEATYLNVAKSKVERKLKLGTSAQLATKHQSSVELQEAKFESGYQAIKNKIEKMEAKKEALIKDIDQKIEMLENDLKRLESSSTGTINYYKQLVERCYEEVPVDVSYPPSHYKKKERLAEILSQIEGSKKSIMVMKAAHYDSAPKIDTAAEEKLARLREAAERQDRELLESARQREREQELEEYNKRKSIRDAEERRVEERRRERASDVIKIPNSTIQIYSSYNDSDHDSEGELLTEQQKKVRRIREKEREKELERDYAEPLPPLPSPRK